MMNKHMRQRKWIDITLTIKSGMVHWPRDPVVRISRRQNMDKGDINNVSLISMGAHTGTHIDAPLHFIAGGESLEKMPFNATIGKARVLAIKERRCIRPEELIPYRIKRQERIIFKTANSNYWERGKFIKNFVYISAEAAEYLVSRGARTVGIDYLSVGGYHKESAQTHRILLEAGIWIIEGLNLKGVKPGDYDLICLPLKILNSDGAPARAVIFPRAKA
jgi:arylformamidase